MFASNLLAAPSWLPYPKYQIPALVLLVALIVGFVIYRRRQR